MTARACTCFLAVIAFSGCVDRTQLSDRCGDEDDCSAGLFCVAGMCQAEAAPTDAGILEDAGFSDAGVADAGASDGGGDAGASDAGALDAGALDAGALDAGADGGSDAGVASDAGPPDAGDAGPRITSFGAYPAAVAPGGETTLSWTADNVTSCDLLGQASGLNANDSFVVTPNASASFVLRCDGAEASVDVAASLPAPADRWWSQRWSYRVDLEVTHANVRFKDNTIVVWDVDFPSLLSSAGGGTFDPASPRVLHRTGDDPQDQPDRHLPSAILFDAASGSGTVIFSWDERMDPNQPEYFSVYFDELPADGSPPKETPSYRPSSVARRAWSRGGRLDGFGLDGDGADAPSLSYTRHGLLDSERDGLRVHGALLQWDGAAAATEIGGTTPLATSAFTSLIPARLLAQGEELAVVLTGGSAGPLVVRQLTILGREAGLLEHTTISNVGGTTATGIAFTTYLDAAFGARDDDDDAHTEAERVWAAEQTTCSSCSFPVLTAFRSGPSVEMAANAQDVVAGEAAAGTLFGGDLTNSDVAVAVRTALGDLQPGESAVARVGVAVGTSIGNSRDRAQEAAEPVTITTQELYGRVPDAASPVDVVSFRGLTEAQAGASTPVYWVTKGAVSCDLERNAETASVAVDGTGDVACPATLDSCDWTLRCWSAFGQNVSKTLRIYRHDDVTIESDADATRVAMVNVSPADLSLTDSSVVSLPPLAFPSVNGVLYIERNDALIDITGLSQLDGLERGLVVRRNALLQTLAGLDSLRDIKGDVIITDNPSLTSLGPLPQLNKFEADLIIERNAVLSDISALIGLNEIRGGLFVRDNPMLRDCDVLAIATQLNNPPDPIVIEGGSATPCADAGP